MTPVNSTQARLNAHTAPLELGMGAQVWLLHPVLGESSQSLFAQLCQQLPWQQPRVQVFGRYHRVPRLTCWLAEKEVNYRYAGLHHLGQGWPSAMASLRATITALTGRQPNGALANLYRHGDDSMGWHRDNEPELGPRPWVLSYNMGATRDFAFRRYGTRRQSHLISLEHDSLLVMAPSVQTYYEHALPRRRRVREARLNLTFRDIVNATGPRQ